MSTVYTVELAPLLSRLQSLGVHFNEERLNNAFQVAQEVYGDTKHWTGVTLLQHTVGVLELLLPFEPDEDAVIACLFHHALQSNMSLPELEEQFGSKVRSLVSGVHLLSFVTLQSRRNSIEDLRLMLLSVSDDVRTVLITLCDRCWLVQHLAFMKNDEAKRVCQDILHLFAPVAARLGIYALKHEMESRAFLKAYESDAENIHQQLERIKKQKGDFLPVAAESVRDYLAQNGIIADVDARAKQPYSIFTKLKAKSMTDVERVYDLFALRVLVGSESECYQALGFLHRIGRPVPNRFKDYIAFPKPNGYQSLHTTIAQLPGVPGNTLVEVQVRTRAMHREAQYGVAAHWSYKEQGSATQAAEQVQLSRLLATQYAVGSEETEGSFADHIFVLTPRGSIIELPEGATPLDFAFQVHTDLGLSFRAARVNGAIVPLDYELENGDIVEIVKRSNPQPSPQWLQMLRMASSRSKLKRYLYAQRRPELVDEGRKLLNAELRIHRLPPLDNDLSLLRLHNGETLALARREDLLMKLGQGAEKPAALLTQLDALKELILTKKQESPGRIQRKGSLIDVEGGVPMPIRFAKCCKAQEDPDGKIIGVINRFGEVMIHKNKCRMAKTANPERRIGVHWRS